MENKKMIYMVYVSIPFGIDDTYYCEYSGIEHDNYQDAKQEMIKAENDKENRVIYAKIEFWEKD